MIRLFRAVLQPLVRRPWRALGVFLLLVPILLGAAAGGVYLWAGYHHRAAREALDHYRPAEARRHLEQCLQVWPHDARTHFLAARAARQDNDPDAAAQHLEECLRLGGEPDPETTALEMVLLKAQRGEIDAVFPYLRSLVDRKDPAWRLALEALALGYLHAYRLAEADYCLRIWLAREPTNVRALYLRGWLKEYWGRSEEAARDYRRVVEQDPDNDEARLRLADALLEVNQPREAAEHLEVLRRRQPENVVVRVRLAVARYGLGRAPEAARLLDEVLADHPDAPVALLERGRIALETGDAALAERCLARAAARMPGNLQAHHLWHQALVRRGKKEEAAKALSRVKLLREDTDRMHEIVTKKMNKNAHDPGLHYQLGMIFMRMGVVSEGLRWLKSALEEDPGYRDAHKALAAYYMRVGNVGRAIYHRERAEGRAGEEGRGERGAGREDGNASPSRPTKREGIR